MPKPAAPVYMDCAATTPIDPRVREEVLRYLDEEFGNAGSRTHSYGARARSAVERARAQVASVVGASRGEVVFTSGATESDNLAILGLAAHGTAADKRHVVSTAIEHHAVLAPLAELERRGFRVDYIPPGAGGVVNSQSVFDAVRSDTLLVSVMHVNNETGAIQPIEEIASKLRDSTAFLHVDAAQSYGREIPALRNPRIDFISVSGHKIHGPKGIGALVARRRNRERPPLEPLMFGGGQELGWRPGTLPVHLIAGFGLAAELALEESETRVARCLEFRRALMKGLAALEPLLTASLDRCAPHIVNLSIPALDSETVIEAWRDFVAISNGAACTSQSYTCSHVLGAMRLPKPQQDGVLRLSWCHFTPLPDFEGMVRAIEHVKREHSL
jgi:cysteine desulfurase